MRLARQLHLYLGIFFAPSIMFFAFSGFLQTYSLHEGDNPTPWMVTLGEIHKNQRIPQAKPQGEAKPQSEARPQSATPAAGDAQGERAERDEERGEARPAASPKAASAPTQAPKGASAALASDPAVSAQPGPQAGNAPAQSRPAGPRPQRHKKSVPLKIFMGFMAVGLISSSLLGIYMSLKINRNPALMWGLLAAGTAIPLIALFAGM